MSDNQTGRSDTTDYCLIHLTRDDLSALRSALATSNDRRSYNITAEESARYRSLWERVDTLWRTLTTPVWTNDLAALTDAVWQLLDDMGTDGLCVCRLAKAKARIAFEPFVNDVVEIQGLMPLQEAQHIMRNVTMPDEHQTTQPDQRDLLVDYLRRARATESNVASHFGLTGRAARRLLIEMELDGLVEQRGMWWETISG